MTTLETTFSIPVIESYGMTEASHQIASNPLPPGQRKAGSVGLAAGPEIAIMADGTLLPFGSRGEIVIRGANVTQGYENNPEANERAFVQGWFRTGDQGYIDTDGYLILTDRIKEIINRGGEKVSPREIDEILLDHPDITQAVTFAIPHPTLGEEVAAVVVLRTPAALTEGEIQRFVAAQLTAFKVPKRVLIRRQIPKGPTGKPQRIGLAHRLKLTRTTPTHSTKDPAHHSQTILEKTITQIWSQVLTQTEISVTANFFALGGDSISAAQIITQMSNVLAIPTLPLVLFLHAPTIRQMAQFIEQKKFTLPPASLVALNPQGSKPPLFCVHPCTGEVLFMTSLAERLGPSQPFYALRARGLDGTTAPLLTVKDMAEQYLMEIEAFQPQGPYYLSGAGDGGLIAFEIAQQLLAKAKPVALLFMMDTLPPTLFGSDYQPPNLSRSISYYLRRIAFYGRQGFRPLASVIWQTFRARVTQRVRRDQTDNPLKPIISHACWTYKPHSYPGRVILFAAEQRPDTTASPQLRIEKWQPHLSGSWDSQIIPGEHLHIFDEPNVNLLAYHINLHLQQVHEAGNA
jgi:thioesterase domain-containing protein